MGRFTKQIPVALNIAEKRLRPVVGTRGRDFQLISHLLLPIMNSHSQPAAFDRLHILPSDGLYRKAET